MIRMSDTGGGVLVLLRGPLVPDVAACSATLQYWNRNTFGLPSNNLLSDCLHPSNLPINCGHLILSNSLMISSSTWTSCPVMSRIVLELEPWERIQTKLRSTSLSLEGKIFCNICAASKTETYRNFSRNWPRESSISFLLTFFSTETSRPNTSNSSVRLSTSTSSPFRGLR